MTTVSKLHSAFLQESSNFFSIQTLNYLYVMSTLKINCPQTDCKKNQAIYLCRTKIFIASQNQNFWNYNSR